MSFRPYSIQGYAHERASRNFCRANGGPHVIMATPDEQSTGGFRFYAGPDLPRHSAGPGSPLPNPDATSPAMRLKPVFSEGHLLGTDQLGRDILSRVIWGTRVSVAVGFAATLIAAIVGSAIGLVAGYASGRTDNLMMRGIDMLMAFPYILLALAIVAVLGPGLMNALYAIAVVNIPFFARNVRGVTLGLAHREFIDAARLSGKVRFRSC